MSSELTLFVPDGRAAPEGSRVLRAARAAGTVGVLVEVTVAALTATRLVVVELDGGESVLASRGDDAWDHSSLAVSDLDTAVAFYTGLLGFEVDFAERGMDAQIESITGLPGLVCDLAHLRSALTGHTLELVAFRPPPDAATCNAPVRPGQGHTAFRVPDLDAAIVAVERLGGQVLGEVTAFEDGRSIYCREPGGSYIELSGP